MLPLSSCTTFCVGYDLRLTFLFCLFSNFVQTSQKLILYLVVPTYSLSLVRDVCLNTRAHRLNLHYHSCQKMMQLNTHKNHTRVQASKCWAAALLCSKLTSLYLLSVYLFVLGSLIPPGSAGSIHRWLQLVTGLETYTHKHTNTLHSELWVRHGLKTAAIRVGRGADFKYQSFIYACQFVCNGSF